MSMVIDIPIDTSAIPLPMIVDFPACRH